jgi:hypothetical protein
MSILWGLIDPIAPGPGSMFLLITTAYWAAFAVIGCTVARRSAVLGVLVPILAFVPSAFLLLSMIWRDVLFAALWLLAAAFVYVFADRGTLVRAVVATLALGLTGFGVLLRPNAIAAAPLLAAYALWPTGLRWKRTALMYLPALAAGYVLIHLVYYAVLQVERQHPLHSLFVFDLGGITHFTGENQFPVSWSTEETALLTSRCYNPDRWDSYWTIDPCRFVMQRLERPDDIIFGTRRLTEAWMRAITGHPLAYLRHRFTYFWTFLTDPNTLTLELYDANDAAKTPLAGKAAFKTMLALHDRLKSTFLFRPWFWLVLTGASFVLAISARETPSGAFSLGVAGSGILYVLAFLPLGVAADFRYAYWCVLACLVSAVACAAAYRERAAKSA